MVKLSKSVDVRRRFVDVARQQNFVVTHQQCVEFGISKDMIARDLAQGAWRRLFPRVYHVNAGSLSWLTLAHAAVLYAGRGARLSHFSAGYQVGIINRIPRVIDVIIPENRRVRSQKGLRIHRRSTLLTSRGTPPMTRPEETVIDLLDLPLSIDDHLGIVTSAVRSGVSSREILKILANRVQHRNRQFLADVLRVVRNGAESPLEFRFHRDVEKPHGLPKATRQARDTLHGRATRADILYEEYGLRVELDGEVGHPGGRTSRDMWRDNEADISRKHLTLRYRWRNIVSTPCETAAQVGRALQQRGWTSQLRRCGPLCQAF